MKPVKLLVLDVDGTLTDGGLYLSETGETLKRFHAQDGLGIVLASHVGLRVAWITGRESSIVQRRAEGLGVAALRQGVRDKTAALLEVGRELGVPLLDMAFMGDDLNDLPAMNVVGLSMAPADAVESVRHAAHWVSSRNGGHGAVREAIDAILTARGDRSLAEKLYLASLEASGVVQ